MLEDGAGDEGEESAYRAQLADLQAEIARIEGDPDQTTLSPAMVRALRELIALLRVYEKWSEVVMFLRQLLSIENAMYEIDRGELMWKLALEKECDADQSQSAIIEEVLRDRESQIAALRAEVEFELDAVQAITSSPRARSSSFFDALSGLNPFACVFTDVDQDTEKQDKREACDQADGTIQERKESPGVGPLTQALQTHSQLVYTVVSCSALIAQYLIQNSSDAARRVATSGADAGHLAIRAGAELLVPEEYRWTRASLHCIATGCHYTASKTLEAAHGTACHSAHLVVLLAPPLLMGTVHGVCYVGDKLIEASGGSS
eukprot:TRINITY_DN24914_c0_g1_i1.p1 TRINITY_DN24914_c0_g1~~TRINITY_DN24914_c0_g1_i1.p1  ORF type:complete len:345 (-),score=48.15 TRINITY_DN24914_c0_g1_i1:153-1109(-)